MTETTVLARKSQIMTADMNGSTVMMDIYSGKYYNLGQTGGRIWELLESPIAVGELVDALTREYSVSREQCLAETVPFLETLLERGLVMKA